MLLVMPAFAADSHSPHPAKEHVILRNGFSYECVQHQTDGDHIRLYTTEENYIEVSTAQIERIEIETVKPTQSVVQAIDAIPVGPQSSDKLIPSPLTHEALHPLLNEAGTANNIDADLLWSIVKAESAGNPYAVSRVGAQGLMQLMPGTASTLGVKNSFAPQQNIAGGAAYLNQLLTRYHDNMELALAAYNAGPEAVDRYHGIPPYRETKLYVVRVISEFNKRKKQAREGLRPTQPTKMTVAK